MPLAFLLDEHFRGPLWQSILRHNLRGEHRIDAVPVGDPPDLPLGANDAAMLGWAESAGRLIVTEDHHTMFHHVADHLAARRHSPGVLIVRS
jgi:hypothetical protein